MTNDGFYEFEALKFKAEEVRKYLNGEEHHQPYFLPTHRQFLNDCIDTHLRFAQAEYVEDRLRRIAELMTPKHKRDLPEDQKPLRSLKLRHWHNGFSGFKHEALPGGYEIHLERWSGDELESESLTVPLDWIFRSWPDAQSRIEQAMRSDWEVDRSRTRQKAIEQAEADLKSARARLEALRRSS